MRRNFLREGGANEILALVEYGGVPLAETQQELTPFQRGILLKGAKKAQEEAESGSPGGPMNSAPGAGQSVQGETVKYVNEGT